MKDKIISFLKKYNLNNPSLIYIVAFSGGYDSMSLLHSLKQIAPENRIIAIHLNHGWRGDESDLEETRCKDFCNQNSVEFYSEKLSEDIAHTETAARDARYDFFKRCAQIFNSEIIFTAHNKNDNAETLIYRICKGTGIKGLQGICEHRDIFYRPLTDISRSEIEKYCKKHKLTPNIDSSNYNTVYKRNFIRSNILPQMEKINKNAVDMINSLSEIACEETQIIEEYLAKISDKIIKNGKLQTKDFIKLSMPVQKRIIYNIFQKYNLDYDRKKIQQIYDFIKENCISKSGKTCSLADNLWLFINEKIIEVITKKENQQNSIHIIKEGEYKIGKTIISIEKFDKHIIKFPKESENIAYVDLSNFEFNFDIRCRNDGDIISPYGLNGTQKLKKYFNSKKIPNHEKESLVLLACEKEILWVPNYGISDKIKVVKRPTHRLTIKKEKL